jgi:penicillin-binding protein 2
MERLAVSPGYHRALENPEHLSPGSVFKALTILAGLESGFIDTATTFPCLTRPELDYHRCSHEHGPAVDLHHALKKSCNAYCYRVGSLVGSAYLVETYRRFGFFDPVPGLFRSDDRQAAILLRDTPMDLSIGMASLRCSPVHAAAIAASLARGRVVRPHLFVPDGFEPIGESLGEPAHLAAIRRGMVAVAEPGGTVDAFPKLQRLKVASKTGTADNESALGEILNQAWLVGYAPADPGRQPEIAFAVVLNHTRGHGRLAAPLSIDAIEAFGDVFPDRRWW